MSGTTHSPDCDMPHSDNLDCTPDGGGPVMLRMTFSVEVILREDELEDLTWDSGMPALAAIEEYIDRGEGAGIITVPKIEEVDA